MSQETFQPAYLVIYQDDSVHLDEVVRRARQSAMSAQVLVKSYSLDGKLHFGKPRKMSYENLPIFLFQCVDTGYRVQPYSDPPLGTKGFYLFSPEYISANNGETKEIHHG